MAGIVGRLEGKGYVRSHLAESDKRVKIVCLTDEGRQICASAKKGMHKLQGKVEQLYSRQELSQLEKYLDRLYELLAEENREACEEKDDQ